MKKEADCIFCKIVAGVIPSPRIFENDEVICIRDIQPQAKVHLLVIPKVHLNSLDEAFPAQGPGKGELIGRVFGAAVQIAREQKILPPGFRTVINTGEGGGQTVHHLHLHLLGGQLMGEKL